ncbi:hypothetical protein AMTRI_Chr06g172510 [Amborella trichopoda]|uniref:uncharacterized protein LOC18438193 isoform X1 n=1 Tax=Amborella trichopoda TaxID=13333 RepID=UPI0005D3F4AC|nr:uncharacterized protein LOC18438193 isoform X1 [Amborella trichopoda]XP_020525546.1 uncharacterized protein LOC18438193 isoform X1 [Amborella trichopoda]|eukprot:XP_011624948.1 uncharacterized protein LOC18438193 isoform X1 [Amborella trichopoda]
MSSSCRLAVVPLFGDLKNKKSWMWILVPSALLLILVYFFGSALITSDYTKTTLQWEVVSSSPTSQSDRCKGRCIPHGTEPLPRSIVKETSDLEMRPLWGHPKQKVKRNAMKNLLAIAVGIKQMELVNKLVKKFLPYNFTVMLFHYDANVDQWRDLEWCNSAIHVSAVNQTKWWFAKRFLHPDIVAEYKYIFLWDEDLGVENFNPGRYLSIIQKEGLEISQPALDPIKSEVHHRITSRIRNSIVHRRTYKPQGGGRCFENSTAPPCTGWVEMMAPVFSRAAWRCSWYMVQNDLIHAWGLDKKLGYCAQGDRSKNVGVVDIEYIVHKGLPTLGGSGENKTEVHNRAPSRSRGRVKSKSSASPSSMFSDRSQVRWQSYTEQFEFLRRWKEAVSGDKCWIDPYPQEQKNKRL